MRYLHTLLLLLLLQIQIQAQTLSIENISTNIQTSLHTHLKGQNKEIVKHLYTQSNYKPIWIGQHNRKKMSELIAALKDPLFNYKNKSFDQKAIGRLFFQLDNNEITQRKKVAVYARLDLILSNSFVRLVRFIVEGDVDWNLVQKKLASLEQTDEIKARWEMSPKRIPHPDVIAKAALEGNIKTYLTSLIPMEKRYRKLVELLKAYRVMDKFPKIPYSNKPLMLGNSASRIKNIKQRLQISGDYPKDAPIDRTFDEKLKQAVITYQKRYLLKVNGIIDKTVTYYLN
ncbi:MAG TPA: murein L,D-transpeptidase, partial [Sulfurovum sp.]|nr:murein L,D-transpeptidase [Sulfurovum sp.]